MFACWSCKLILAKLTFSCCFFWYVNPLRFSTHIIILFANKYCFMPLFTVCMLLFLLLACLQDILYNGIEVMKTDSLVLLLILVGEVFSFSPWNSCVFFIDGLYQLEESLLLLYWVEVELCLLMLNYVVNFFVSTEMIIWFFSFIFLMQ